MRFRPGAFAASSRHASAAAYLPIRLAVNAALAPVMRSTCVSSCERYCTGTGLTMTPVSAQAR